MDHNRQPIGSRLGSTKSTLNGLARLVAIVTLGCSILVGFESGTAAAGPVTGRITLYPLGSDNSPSAIVGTTGGDLWYVDEQKTEACSGPCDYASRITVGGSPDGSVLFGFGTTSLNNLALDSAGDAFVTDDDVEASEVTSGLSLIAHTNQVFSPGNPNAEQAFGAVAVSGSTPYWGSDNAVDPADQFWYGLPVINSGSSTVAPITSMTTGTSGEIDMIQGSRDFGFYSGGTLTTCDGVDTVFPSNSNIVELTSGSAGIWFADSGRDSVWQYDGSCQGSEYPVPDGTAPRDITEGSDGNIYFSTSSGIWELDPASGVFTQYTAPGLVDPEGITLGSDGNIWFTDTSGHQIGKLVPFVPTNPYGVLHSWTFVGTGSGNSICVPCHWNGVNLRPPQGFGDETTLGYVYQDAGPGLVALYACTDGATGDFLSVDPSGACGGGGSAPPGSVPTDLGIQGYVYSAPPTDGTDALELFQCQANASFDDLVTTLPPPAQASGRQQCGDDPTDYSLVGSLGYVVDASVPPAATPEVPAVPLLGLSATAALGGSAVWLRRRRSI